VITAATITDAQIVDLRTALRKEITDGRRAATDPTDFICNIALGHCVSGDRDKARAHCAQVLNDRAKETP
jgi:hypothetical protein